jgi:two-component system CheB/CheR fusion protein
MIRRNVEIEGRLIDDLLDLARIARGQLRLDLQPVDAYELLCTSLETCRWEIEQRRQRAVLQGTPDECWMHADPTRMQQVVWNVLRNAIKFTEEGGEIVMRCRCDEDQIVLEIVDNGVGMDEETLHQILASINSMATAEPGAGSPGLGLGLAIAGTHVRAHRGRLEIESAGRNRGSTVRIIVPAAEPRSAVAEPEADVPEVSQSASSPLRILLVEDHHDSAQVLARLLRHKGHAVEVAGCVSAALAAAREHEFDVLISDVALPDGNGLELMRQLASSGIHGIAVSGFGSAADVERSRAAGFAAHVVKPITVADLWSALEDLRARLDRRGGGDSGRYPQVGNGRAD